MKLTLTRRQVRSLLKVLDGPSVANQHLAILYDTIQAQLEAAEAPKPVEKAA